MEAIVQFFDMGGYAAFIWPAYGVAALILLALIGASLREMRQREALAETLRRDRRSARIPGADS